MRAAAMRAGATRAAAATAAGAGPPTWPGSASARAARAPAAGSDRPAPRTPGRRRPRWSSRLLRPVAQAVQLLAPTLSVAVETLATHLLRDGQGGEPGLDHGHLDGLGLVGQMELDQRGVVAGEILSRAG